MSIKNLLLGLLAFVGSQNAFSLDFSRVNIAWQYDPLSNIKVAHRTTQEGDQFKVFFRIASDSLSHWLVEYNYQAEYDTEVHQQMKDFEIDTLKRTAKEVLVAFSFRRPDGDLLFLELTSPYNKLYYDVPLKNGSIPFPSFYPTEPYGLPIFSNFINLQGANWANATKLHATGYLEDFPFADPPMAKMKPLAPSIAPDTSFMVTPGQQLLPGYFYLVREDSTDAIGVTVLQTAPYFPEFKRLDELAGAMQYLLNESEMKAMQNSTNLKSSFDSFWLNTYQSKFRARNAIRNYYNWVEQANHLFTDFKEGWKTDRGMLFIVFGVPDEVYRTENSEEWYYDNGPAFEFSIIATFFNARTYGLKRRIEFEAPWYDNLAAIRRGSNE